MNMKHLPLLAVILAVIIGIIIVSNQLSNRRPSEKSLAFFPQFSEAECSAITVCDFKDTAYLVRKGKDWMVSSRKPAENAATPFLSSDTSGKAKKIQEYPADSAIIQTAMDKLRIMKKDELISQNPQKQAELGVDSMQAVRVDIAGDKGLPVGSFYLGKESSDWTSNFVRVKGSNDVYLVAGSLKYSLFTDKNRWKDKTITKFDRTFAKSIEIAKKDSASILLSLTAPSPKDSAAKPGWHIVSPVKDSAKNEEVDKILNTMAKFLASDFEEDTTISADSLGFISPLLRVTVLLENGEKKNVIVGHEKGSEGKRWVRTPDKPVTFLVYKYNIDNLDRSVNALRGIPEKKLEPVKPPAKKAAPGKIDKKKPAAKPIKKTK